MGQPHDRVRWDSDYIHLPIFTVPLSQRPDLVETKTEKNAKMNVTNTEGFSRSEPQAMWIQIIIVKWGQAE